jgi:hypothetical protein
VAIGGLYAVTTTPAELQGEAWAWRRWPAR